MEKNGELQQALTALIQSQATLTQTQAEFVRDMSEIRRDFEVIKSYLIRQEQLLANLPEAIRQKIGFKPK